MIKFFKYNSNGNDFIIIDSLDESFDYLTQFPERIQRLCTRQFSIGADGLILLKKSKVADYKMMIFNSDGRQADMCGNGLLSLIKFISEFIDRKKTFLIETKAAIYQTFVNADKVSFKAKFPKILKESLKINIDESKYDLTMLNSGVFHGVIFTKNIGKIDVFKVGRKIRNLKDFEPGINVNFCEVIDRSTIKVRTYEKGVENETYCCSTGALAVSFSYFLKNKNVNELDLQYIGGNIKTCFEKDEIKLTSEPALAYRGFL